jgi:hypothetical protein
VKTRMNLWFPYHAGTLLTHWVTVTSGGGFIFMVLISCFLSDQKKKAGMFCVLQWNFSPQKIADAVNLTADNCTFLQFHLRWNLKYLNSVIVVQQQVTETERWSKKLEILICLDSL